MSTKKKQQPLWVRDILFIFPHQVLQEFLACETSTRSSIVADTEARLESAVGIVGTVGAPVLIRETRGNSRDGIPSVGQNGISSAVELSKACFQHARGKSWLRQAVAA